jgi:hypothetical protein
MPSSAPPTSTFPPYLPLQSFFPGLLWGYLYHRHKTIIGVSISHILLGLYAVYILRFVMMANI